MTIVILPSSANAVDSFPFQSIPILPSVIKDILLYLLVIRFFLQNHKSEQM